MNKKIKNKMLEITKVEPKVVYLGFGRMLDKIYFLMDECNFKEKLKLIDKYIELVKEINKEHPND